MATGGVVVTRLPESKVREWIADVCPNQRDETRRVALGTHSAIVFDMTAGQARFETIYVNRLAPDRIYNVTTDTALSQTPFLSALSII